jgi:23S rRNA pseudouridine1911/1915/1917 synthase
MRELGFEILFESDACLAVAKPPGLLTQAPPGIDSLEVRIKAYLAGGQGEPGAVYLGVPHRIDRPASGALVFGKTRRATRKLAQQFERRMVTKVYWACVAGEVTPAAGTWRDFVRKVPNEARAEVAGADHPDAQVAVLHYRTLGTRPWGNWLMIELETGRTHQIRVQAASRGHPVLGDFQYGSTVPFGPQQENERLRVIALHARSLGFRHPKTREEVSVTAPLPADWSALGVEPTDD